MKLRTTSDVLRSLGDPENLVWLSTTQRPDGTAGFLSFGLIGDLLLVLAAIFRKPVVRTLFVATPTTLVMFRSSARFVHTYERAEELPISGSIQRIDMTTDPFIQVGGAKYFFELALYRQAEALYDLSRR